MGSVIWIYKEVDSRLFAHRSLLDHMAQNGKITQPLAGASTHRPLTEQLNVYLLQGMGAAELIELVMNFIEDQGLIVVCGVVSYNIVH